MLPRAPQIILSLAFLLAICSPAAVWIGSGPLDVSETEGRRLAAFPKVEADENLLKVFPKEFERYFDDHYGFRSALIELNRAWKSLVFKKSFTRRVIRGQDDWLFFNDRGSLADFMGLKRVTEDELDDWQQQLENKKYWLNHLGIEYLFVSIPNKMTVYPEFLPIRARANQGESRLDQLAQRLGESSSVEDYLSLTDVFIEAKDYASALIADKVGDRNAVDEGLYLRTDTHWTSLAAFIAYDQIMKNLSARLQGLGPTLTLDDVEINEREATKTDLARLLGLSVLESHRLLIPKSRCWDGRRQNLQTFKSTEAYKIKKERRPQVPLPQKTSCATRDLKAVISHDSFGSRIRMYFAESFREVVFMSDFDTLGMETFLRDFQPDVFIDLRVERLVPALLETDQGLSAAVARIKDGS